MNRTLRSISRNDTETDDLPENVRYLKPPTYQQFDRFKNDFVDDSSTPYWNKRENENYVNLRNDFIPNSRKVIFTIDELQNPMNASRIENGQLWDTKRSTVSGFPELASMNQFDDGNQDTLANDSTNNEKRKLTRRYFVTVCAICYAIFLVVFGAIIFIGDVVASQYPLPQAFCIYMVLMSFAYFLYLYIDIEWYVYRVKKQLKLRLERKKLIDAHIIKNMLYVNGFANFNETRERQAIYAQAARELNLPPMDTALPHKYCFISGRNGGSMYIKLGASWFAFGLLVYSALQITYDAYFISSNGDYLYECASHITLTLNILFPLYSLFSLFFIIKYMNVVINVNQNLARIFIMHAIGTSLTLWVFTIIRETTDAIAKTDAENSKMLRVTHSNETFEFVYNDCGKPNALNVVHRTFAPYLYPFVIEYCILVVGIWCKIYTNINHCPRKTLKTNYDNAQATAPQQDQTSETSSIDSSAMNLSQRYEKAMEHDEDIVAAVSYVYADCQSSFHGIFVGLLLAIMTIVFIILMFVGFQNKSYLKTSILMNNIFECVVLIILIVSTLIAYSQTIKLDVIFDPALTMDDVLLLIAIPAFFMDFLFSLSAAIFNDGVLSICISIFRLAQTLIQTPFIIDGKRRCSKSTLLQKKKIGREFVMFLAIANMSLWIYYTFSGNLYYAEEGYAHYGTFLNILNHITLPLIMFYRFHASVCLVDIWNHAYETQKHQ